MTYAGHTPGLALPEQDTKERNVSGFKIAKSLPQAGNLAKRSTGSANISPTLALMEFG